LARYLVRAEKERKMKSNANSTHVVLAGSYRTGVVDDEIQKRNKNKRQKRIFKDMFMLGIQAKSGLDIYQRQAARGCRE
jgi:hypothetical protein